MPLFALELEPFVLSGLLLLLIIIATVLTINYFASVVRTVHQHIGVHWKKGAIVARPVTSWERVNLFLALEALREATPNSPRVFSLGHANDLASALAWGTPRNAPLAFTVKATSLTSNTKVVACGLYLLHPPGLSPFAAMLSGGSLEVLTATPETAQEALDRILAEAATRNIYRGQVLVVEQATYAGEEIGHDFQIRFHDLPKVTRDEIILPEEVLKVVERNVIGLLAHAETLRKAGRSTRHGVLFHGPPGVGKTLVTKYLARACPNYTVILLTGRQLHFVRESCVLARLLQPALVVIEDVDLIALDRSQSFNTTLLHDLMDEMDGLGQKADVIFLLTTNRPRLLESALAARPGRVDQAVYFPLPDHECRRRLFAHFGIGLDLSSVEIEPILDRTDGASPAFIAELFRKAALMAAERGETSSPLKLTNADFLAAIRELVEFGGVLTQQLLGYRSDPDSGHGNLGFNPTR